MNQYHPNPARYDAMKYRRCGRSGVILPEISIGLWQNFGGIDPFERSRSILRYAFDHGITHFDLANNYGPPYGSAEETFGRMMKLDFAPFRDEMFISSKAGFDMWPGPYGNWGSRKYLMASLDQSLRRMNLEYVDLFYHHRFDPGTPIEETLQALVDIVRAGKALYIGISNWPAKELAVACDYLAARDVPLLIYQGRLNMVDRAPISDGQLALCRDRGTGFIAYSPLAQGLLTDHYLSGDIPSGSRMDRRSNLTPDRLTPEMLAELRRLNAEASDAGMSLAEYALRWVLRQEGVTSVIVGARSTEQLAANLRAIDNISD